MVIVYHIRMTKNLVIAALGVAVIGLAFMYAQKDPAAPSAAVPTPPHVEEPRICAQVITPARNPETSEIREFPTPCDVPEGWELIENDIPDLELNLE